MATQGPILAARCRAIYASCSQLDIDDDTRRKMMLELPGVGVESTKHLTLDKASLVLDHLRKLGADNPKKTSSTGRYPGAPSTLDSNAMYQKIEALLTDMKLPWNYADTIAENITGGRSGGIPRLGWVKDKNHLKGIVSALAAKHKKEQVKAWAFLDAELTAHGRDLEWCRQRCQEAGVINKPWLWRECLQTLDWLVGEVRRAGKASA